MNYTKFDVFSFTIKISIRAIKLIQFYQEFQIVVLQLHSQPAPKIKLSLSFLFVKLICTLNLEVIKQIIFNELSVLFGQKLFNLLALNKFFFILFTNIRNIELKQDVSRFAV